uniref:Uncharacterized protein n=1 Tax=Arundo donax TaxID=35708 RepID=A0A0A9EQG4_ARUDO
MKFHKKFIRVLQRQILLRGKCSGVLGHVCFTVPRTTHAVPSYNSDK